MVVYKVTFYTLSNEILKRFKHLVQILMISKILFFKQVLEGMLFCGSHLGFESTLFCMTTDVADGSEILVELYVALFRLCNNCNHLHVLAYKPV